MLAGLPVEMLTMLGSSLLGGVMTIWGQKAKEKANQQKMLLARGKFQMDEIDKARRYKKEVVMDKIFTGVVITPLDTHLMSAIVGLYFGGSLVQK